MHCEWHDDQKISCAVPLGCFRGRKTRFRTSRSRNLTDTAVDVSSSCKNGSVDGHKLPCCALSLQVISVLATPARVRFQDRPSVQEFICDRRGQKKARFCSGSFQNGWLLGYFFIYFFLQETARIGEMVVSRTHVQRVVMKSRDASGREPTENPSGSLKNRELVRTLRRLLLTLRPFL